MFQRFRGSSVPAPDDNHDRGWAPGWRRPMKFIKLMFKLLNEVVCRSGRRKGVCLTVSAVVLPALPAGMKVWTAQAWHAKPSGRERLRT